MPEPDLLARVDLFAGLTSAERAPLVAKLRRRAYTKGAPIFLRGDPGSTLYVVQTGQVRLVLVSDEGKEFALDLLGPGACFGELALLTGDARSADAIAQEDCRLLLLHRVDFDAFLAAQPRVTRALLAILAARLRRDAELLHEVLFLDVPARLARVLLQMAAASPASPSDPQELRATQEELAGLLGLSRESVNKWLGYFEQRGWLRRQRGGLALLRPTALRAVASGDKSDAHGSVDAGHPTQ